MSNTVEVRVPDIGDFEEVEIIEVLVSEGDTINVEDSVITLESDKATMEIPAPNSGTVSNIAVKTGERVSEGDLILTMTADSADASVDHVHEETTGSDLKPETVVASSAAPGEADLHAEVLVLGAGPGGYTAAFRAADLGKKTILVERYPTLGGVCLNVGCIPSKALLHTAEVISEAAEIAAMGVEFGKPKINLDKMRAGKEKVVAKLTTGLSGMAKARQVEVVEGVAAFTGDHSVKVESDAGSTTISFDYCIIAVGSQAVKIPVFPNEDPRLIDSTGALELEEIPGKMLVIGGGIIGLEMASFYGTHGSKIDIVELQGQLMPGAD